MTIHTACKWLARVGMLCTLLIGLQQPALGDVSVVRAVLFYSPTCSHCHDVIEDVIRPLVTRYGRQLQILAVNVHQENGRILYNNAIRGFSIPDDRRGVPTLIIGEQVLVGGAEIPHNFPALVEKFLAQGGIDFPFIPGLQEMSKIKSDEGQYNIPNDISSGPFKKFAQDPIGNSLAIIVLVIMVIILLYNLIRLPADIKSPHPFQAPGSSVALIALIGLGVSGYMAYVETTHISAICGPVGDCNTVQQSQYARLFGIPLGILGIVGYLFILGAWLLSRSAAIRLAAIGRLVLYGFALAGTIFSIYLTFLEPFVIGATCAWCLGSALCMALLLIFTRRPAVAAWSTISSQIK